MGRAVCIDININRHTAR